MTAYSMTVTNSLRVFGGGPSSLWNAYNWNAFKWGEGTVKIPMNFRHAVDVDPLVMTSARNFRFVHAVDVDPLTLDSTQNFNFTVGISNSLGLTSDAPDQYLTDSEGYNHLFPGGVTDAHERVASTWSAGAGTSPTWTQGAASSTSWSSAT